MHPGAFYSNSSSSQIVMGTAGWEGEDDHFFPGEFDNDGCTLVRVQLFDGRDNTKPLNPKIGQGRQIVCQISNSIGVPPKGARCYVAIPEGMMQSPGAGVIFATVGGGSDRGRNVTAGDVVIAPKGDDAGQAMVVVSKNGEVTLHATDTNAVGGNSLFIRVSPTAIQFVAPFGRMIFDAAGVHWTTKSGARLDFGGINIPGIPGALSGSFTSYARLSAATVKLAGGSVYLGQGTYYQPVVTTLPTVLATSPLGVPTAAPGNQPTLIAAPSVWITVVSP